MVKRTYQLVHYHSLVLGNLPRTPYEHLDHLMALLCTCVVVYVIYTLRRTNISII
jgi:hypothetical protein